MLTNMDGTPAITIDQATLDEIVRRILSVASPEKIILFGSATGEMIADSHLDLLRWKDRYTEECQSCLA